jgi:LPS-assembly protein
MERVRLKAAAFARLKVLCDFIAKSHQQATMPLRLALRAVPTLTLLACSAWAQEVPPPETGGLGLKLQRELLPPVAADASADIPIFVEADRLQGEQGRYIELQGNASLRRRGETVWGDLLRYSFTSNDVTANGNVRVERLGDVVTGEQAYFDLNNDTGYVNKPTYRMRQFHARGGADRVLIKDRDTYRVIRGTYTTCDLGDDDWYLKVQRMDLDRLQDTGTARNATLYFKNVPVLYTPWIDFPLSSRRKTGFLPPTYGSTAKSGFEVTVPFYWNIKPYMDYTIAPRVLSRRGVLLNNEFRYMRPSFNGEMRFEYLPDDRVKGESRYGLSLLHSHDFGHGLSAYLNVQRVSDDAYFTDLSDKIAATSQTVLPQEGQLTYQGSWWSLTGRVQRFQTLQDPLAVITPPYARSPQVTLLASKQNVKGLDLDLNGEAVNFRHPSLLSGWRQLYYPSASLPLRTPLFYVTPKVGVSYTRYAFTHSDRTDETRTLPILSVDSGTSFERDITLNGRELTQTLEPRLYYLYIPFRDQTQLPVFDTALKDFNFTSIFSENKFSGGDRINDANQITAAVITRIINPTTGAETLRALLGQRYYFEPQRVTLDSALPTTPVPSNAEPANASRSDLLAAFSGSLTRSWSLDTGLQYGVNNSEIERFNIAIRNQPEPGKVLNIAYRYTRGLTSDFINQVDLSAQWPLSRRWNVLGRWNYSLSDSALLEALAGLEYNAGCWAFRFLLHRFVTNTQERTSAVFFQIELTGLSRIGSNPLELLRQGIGGYSRPSLRPLPTGEYYPGMDQP